MKYGHTPLVVGNWKMNPSTKDAAKRLAQEVKKAIQRVKDVDVVLAPSHLHLESVRGVQNGSAVFQLGIQNVHHEKLGAHTGEVSLPMVKDFGVSHVIIGHSERRKDGETDEMIERKVGAVIKSGLTVVLCVGELERDHSAHYFTHIESQIRSALKGIPRAKLPQVVIAYEPVWAIGTGKTPTPEDVHEMKLFIEKTLSDIYGRNLAQKVRILYGGSVNTKNAGELYQGGSVHGFLVGGASLTAAEFVGIVKSVTA